MKKPQQEGWHGYSVSEPEIEQEENSACRFERCEAIEDNLFFIDPMHDSEAEKRYYLVGRLSEIRPGAGISVQIGHDTIAVFNFGGGIFALNDLCPHRGAPLCEGFLDDGKVFCPWHCFDFNLRTGECTTVPSMSVATYQVKIEGDEIYILY